MRNMNVLVSPFSGAAFPHQLAIVANLSLCSYVPSISLGTSGGNVVNYIAAAADWNYYSILRIGKMINSSLFVKKWSNLFKIYFNGSMYDRPPYIEKFYNSIFDTESINKYELWTGTYSPNKRKAVIFCNKENSQSIMENKLDIKKLGCDTPIYLNGDIKRISLACEASAAIPTIVPSVMIDDNKYYDGGLAAASPFTYLADSLPSKDVHLTYVSGFDIEEMGEKVTSVYSSIINVTSLTINTLTNSIYYKDRARAIDFIQSKEEKVYTSCGSCDIDKMKEIERKRKDTICSLVEYYPASNKLLKLTAFDSKDVSELVKETMAKFNYRLWWKGEKIF